MGRDRTQRAQLPHDDAVKREDIKVVAEDRRRDRSGTGYLVVLAGAAGFVASCFVPYYGIDGLGGPVSETVSLYPQGSLGGDSVAWHVGSLLFLFGGVATVVFVAIAGMTRRGPRTAPTVLAATVVAWSLTWIGLMIQQATFALRITLEWGFWLQAVSVGVVVIGTVLAAASPTAGVRS